MKVKEYDVDFNFKTSFLGKIARKLNVIFLLSGCFFNTYCLKMLNLLREGKCYKYIYLQLKIADVQT